MPRRTDPAVESLARRLEDRTTEADPALVRTLPEGRVRCLACGHRCVVLDGLDGVCRVRHNRGGRLLVPRGYVAGLQVDPIEKKPFFHVLPGADALSFGMLGCDYHCSYCQNWLTSQTLRNPAAQAGPSDVRAEEIVETATRHRAPVMVSTYNEPLITSEWAVEVFRLARDRGIVCGYVSNGNATPEVLDYLRPWMQLYKIDLKSFRDAAYRRLGGTLQNVLDTIRNAHARGFWVEIVTLLVPGFNDSRAELEELTAFVAEVSPDIPWHVTAFHKDYKMTDPADTTAADLVRAARIGKDAGLRYVYAGNLPGRVGDLEHTRCPGCNACLIERHGYRIGAYRITDGGTCPECETAIAGFWRPDWQPAKGGADGRVPRRVTSGLSRPRR
jgi:pyruvate formate lyase activating enzyme